MLSSTARNYCFASVWLILITTTVYPQRNKQAGTPMREPVKQIEAFRSKTNTVVVRGASHIGRMDGDTSGHISIDVEELTDVNTGSKAYGISISVDETTSSLTSTSFVDYDDIDPLIKGVDFMAKINSGCTKMDDYQAHYRDRSGLHISKINAMSSGTEKYLMGVVSGVDKEAACFFSADSFPILGNMIKAAKRKIDLVKRAK